MTGWIWLGSYMNRWSQHEAKKKYTDKIKIIQWHENKKISAL